MEITLRRVTQEDKAEWFRMRKGIWPDAPDEYMTFDMDDILADDDYMVIFACDGDRPIGLTEARIRDYGEGCETSPVGYLEGWFVQEEYRGKRIAGMMTQAAENWIREKGCTEVASDTWLDNESSIRAHVNMGYYEVERLVHFVKQL
ncbi:MAG: GNAT family N-acetyltransferase [Anaerolineales bacterium]|nr:GNAT family N-acetyltransferase [Anaerolineales bacterium]